MCFGGGGPSKAEKEAAAEQRVEADLAKQEEIKKKAEAKREDISEAVDRRSQRRGNLILLLEDPRIIHLKVNTAAALGNTSISGGKPNTGNLVQSQLLETLAAWRETHGVPVSLVVFMLIANCWANSA